MNILVIKTKIMVDDLKKYGYRFIVFRLINCLKLGRHTSDTASAKNSINGAKIGQK